MDGVRDREIGVVEVETSGDGADEAEEADEKEADGGAEAGDQPGGDPVHQPPHPRHNYQLYKLQHLHTRVPRNPMNNPPCHRDH